MRCPPLLFFGFALALAGSAPGLALPPPDEVPEEVLRTEVITEARSPFDGESLSPADYAALQDQLRDPNVEVRANPNLAHFILLLQFRRVLRPILPILP